MSLLDRYVLRNFLEPFFMSFAGFVAIWFIIDLSDNFNDFLEAHATFKLIASYYVGQLPATVMMSTPVAIMLGLLFSLSRMSRRNEIISMLTAGRSVVRVLAPLIFVGVATTALCLWLNWVRAPHAEWIKKNGISQIKRGKKADAVEPILAHLFRDRQNNRTWYVRRLKIGSDLASYRMEGVHVTQQDATGRILEKWYAGGAYYYPETQTWKLEKGMIVDFTPDGDIAQAPDADHKNPDRFPPGTRIITDWSETPWRVASSELDPATLGVQELHDYLLFNADFPAVQLAPYRANLTDRYALPFQCLLAVFIAAPLGIVFNRRGAIGGVATAIALLVVMLMSHSFFLMLGKGLRMDPRYSPWVPDVALGLVGLVLLWYRSTNRDYPKFTFSLQSTRRASRSITPVAGPAPRKASPPPAPGNDPTLSANAGPSAP